MDLVFENWGLIDYELALRNQESLVELVHTQQKPPTVIFCQHPPLVTKGRATQAEDITDWSGPIYEINRGGRATYHGPSQLMIYPIIPIDISSHTRKASDVGAFLRQFELALVDVLMEFGISAQGKSSKSHDPANSPPSVTMAAHLNPKTQTETGVWIGNKKIASLGLSIRHWVTFHGAALNIEIDPQAFQGIKPCGFSPSIMTNMEEQLKYIPNRDHIINSLKKTLQDRL